MTVRAFSGTTDDDIICATGALAGMQYGVIAAIIKRTGASNYRPFFNPHDSSGNAMGSFLSWQSGNVLTWFDKSGSRSAGSASLTTNVWYLVVVRKTQGVSQPRFSFYNYTTATWTHQNGVASLDGWTVPGASGSIRFTYQTEPDNLDGSIAARAAWSNILPWSADTTGDTALEAAGLQAALKNWFIASPTALWIFNQESVATPVTDLTGGGADQTSIIGTSVVTTDDPPGFSFTLPRWRRGDGVILRPFVKTGGGLVELA